MQDEKDKKYFRVIARTTVLVEYDENEPMHKNLNRNHVMYQAQKILNDNPRRLETHRLHYEVFPAEKLFSVNKS